MRRAQSLRNNNLRKSSTISSGADDLGILSENGEESPEGVMARQMVAAERENDKLKAQVLSLQDALSQRPPIEHIQELEREYKNLELILIGTQRENERCMAELERVKDREKMLERELQKLAGDNWQTSLNIPASTTLSSRSTFMRPAGGVGVGMNSADITSMFLPQAESTHTIPGDIEESASAAGSSISFIASSMKSGLNESREGQQDESKAAPGSAQTALAHIAQVRALILGMEERMQDRENRLAAEVARAESETRRFDIVRKEVDGVS